MSLDCSIFLLINIKRYTLTQTETNKVTTSAAPPIKYSSGTGKRFLLLLAVDCEGGSLGSGNSSSTMPVPAAYNRIY